MADSPRFGELPLPQTVAAAAAMRRLTNLLLTLEHDHPTVDGMLARFAEWESELGEHAPAEPTPRFGPDPHGRHRLYLQRVFDVGAFNPCFPTYEFDRLEPDSAAGRVSFPIAYEGPPGLVHGGFLGVFFDCVVQHHNCATAPSGMTRAMTVSYRKPVPLLTELRFDVTRSGSTSTARLLYDDVVLCTGEVEAVALPAALLTGIAFGARRSAATP